MLQKPDSIIGPNTILSVSDASNLLKGVIETAFADVKIKGELSQITKASSGHIYMTIKDSKSAINVIVWRGTNINFKLEEGLEVIITGHFTIYPARSNYQLIVNTIEIAGIGAILKMLEERKQRLAAEGLFDISRKKTLPLFPKTIGIVTSPTGAAFQDIQNRLKERFPVKVILYPATVQGDTASKEIVAGIKYFNQKNNVDVIIVARGGGALEDLLPFSEENVVRAVADSKIPLISGVGHEPDWMLIDFAADVRAPTPTGAAEIVVPTKIKLFQDINNLSYRLTTSCSNTLISIKQKIMNISIKNPKQIIFEQYQRIDDTVRTLNIIIDNTLTILKQQLNTTSNIRVYMYNNYNNLNQSICHINHILESLSYKNVLKRGYAIVRDKLGKIIQTANDTPTSIEFYDGILKI